jgi:hypothetical protein
MRGRWVLNNRLQAILVSPTLTFPKQFGCQNDARDHPLRFINPPISSSLYKSIMDTSSTAISSTRSTKSFKNTMLTIQQLISSLGIMLDSALLHGKPRRSWSL